MSLTALFKRSSKQGVTIGALELDATISEGHTMTNTITDHPVERGAVINDHIVKEPKIFSVEGMVTNSPIIFLAGLRSSQSRAKSAFDELERIRDDGELITIVSTYKTYTNMALLSLDAPRVRETGDSLRFTAEFKQIIKAEAQLTALDNDVLDDSEFRRFSSEQNIGKQTPVELEGSAAQGSSIAASVFGGLF